nr:hypothetical protein [uncultured Lichenicoccus sp.]
MTTLSFRSDRLTIQASVRQVQALTAIAQTILPGAGYTDTKFEGHVFAAKNGCLVDIVLLPIGGLLSWQVVLVAGPTQAACDAIRDEAFGLCAGRLQQVPV